MSSSINAGKFFPNKWKITLPVFYNYGQTKITPLFNPLDPDVRMTAVESNPAISDGLKQRIKDQVIDYTERKGFNLSNVRIDGLKRKGAKPMPWDVSNFSVTFAYTQIYKHSVNVETNINKQYRGHLQYAYSVQNPLKIKPFSKMAVFDNKWFTLIKEFNLQLVPNGFGVSMDGSRTFAALKNRDITSFYANSGTSDFVNPILYNKNFTITRAYNLRWDLNKAIKFDYTANNDGRVLEPYGDVSKRGSPARDSVISNLKKGGTTTQYRQQMNLTVTVPINKIPIFDFISTLSYRYSGSYTWTRMPFAIPDSLNIGNTIQYTNSHNATANLNMTMLYNKIPYFKRLNSPPAKHPPPPPNGKKAPGALAAKGQSTDQQQDTTKKKPNKFQKLFDFLARTIMMVKSVSGTVQKTGGQGMPNFRPSSQYGGMDASAQYAPGFLFTTGLSDPLIRERSLANGWIVKTKNQTTPYTELNNINFTYKAAIEPHKSLKIDLTGTYNKQKTLTEYMGYDSTGNNFSLHNSPNETGNFEISNI